MTTITVSSRGQIVIPAAFRKRLKLKSGDQLRVKFDDENNKLTMEKVESIDEMATRFNSWIKPGTEPLMDVRAFMDAREPRTGL